jgi:hypothetical protein
MNFKSLFQNLVGILKCTFKQSCRVENSKQLLFWDQIVKMDIWWLKNRKLLLFFWKRKRKGILFFKTGRRPAFGPPEQAGPLQPPAWPRSCACPRSPAGPRRRVDARVRLHPARVPGGPRRVWSALHQQPRLTSVAILAILPLTTRSSSSGSSSSSGPQLRLALFFAIGSFVAVVVECKGRIGRFFFPPLPVP